MSTTFFSGAPHWTWFIIPYFFVAASRAAALPRRRARLVRPARDRPVVRTGYDVAASGRDPLGLLLTIDLGRPLRFWHMLFQSRFPRPHVQRLVAHLVRRMAILLFGLFSVLSALGARAERGGSSCPALRAVGGGEGGVASSFAGVGGLLGSSSPATRGSSVGHQPPHLGRQPVAGGVVSSLGRVDRRATLILFSQGAAQRNGRSVAIVGSTPGAPWSSCSC